MSAGAKAKATAGSSASSSRRAGLEKTLRQVHQAGKENPLFSSVDAPLPLEQLLELPTLLLDSQGRIKEANQAFCQWAALDADKIKGAHFFSLLDASEKQRWKQLQKRSLSSLDASHSDIFHLHGKDGALLAGRLTARAFSGADGLRIKAVLLDKTGEEKTSQSLQESRCFTQNLLQAVHHPLVLVNEKMAVQSVNDAFCEMLGRTREEILRQPLEVVLNFWWDNEDLRHFLERAVREGAQVQTLAAHLEMRSGEKRAIQFRACRSCFDEGSEVLLAIGLEDLTPLQRLDEQLSQLERRFEQEIANREKEIERGVQVRTGELKKSYAEMEAFCYTVAHDLRAPLRAMEGFANALIEDFGERLDELGRDYVQRITCAAGRMDKLIEDLMAYAKLVRSRLPLHAINLNSVVEMCLENFRPEIERSQAKVIPEFPFPPVAGHSSTLSLILNHLLSNALKFCEPGAHPLVMIRAIRNEHSVRLEVKDHGIGINPLHFDRIFGVFERLHGSEAYPGTGIGLAMVRKGIEQMGGAYGVASSPGQGSCFWFELPTPEAKWGQTFTSH